MATRTNLLWVLDTSVAVAWFAEEDQQHEAAVEVRRAIRDNPRTYVVPALFYSELVHALTRRWDEVDQIRAAVGSVIRFGMRTLFLSEPALLCTADWSCKGLGGYDGTFVALAEDLGGRWLTADTRAARIADEHAVTLLGWTRIQRRGS